ncbi:MAG: hypothetical protein KIT80_05730 [Chitinophagaceae bacterium]|nr:hypothetical protein [Chitinophagaceae bacterium]MCW5926397.1 hypothetical protein [Chitinophagaceae bacterium]
MKQYITTLALIAIITGFASCEKEDEKSETLIEEIQGILPKQYIDSLKAYTFPLNDGKTPPTINGIYAFQPVNEHDNSGVFDKGEAAVDATIKVANQAGTNADVFIKGWVAAGQVDTSSAQIIAGKNNDFTVYAQARGGFPEYVYAYIISGVHTPGGIQYFRMAFVMINDGGNPLAAAKGTIRIFNDKDNIAAPTPVFRNSAGGSSLKPAGAPK